MGQARIMRINPGPRRVILLSRSTPGYAYLRQMDIIADVVIGDFDSLGFCPKHPHVITLLKEKDETDMLAALKCGLEKGYRSFHIYGGTGGRMDHTIANMQSLSFLALRGAQGFLYGRDYAMTCIHNARMDFDSGYRGVISIFAHSNVAGGVTLKGLQYELENAELHNDDPLGISNAFTGVKSSVSVEKGSLIIVFPCRKRRKYV